MKSCVVQCQGWEREENKGKLWTQASAGLVFSNLSGGFCQLNIQMEENFKFRLLLLWYYVSLFYEVTVCLVAEENEGRKMQPISWSV